MIALGIVGSVLLLTGLHGLKVYINLDFSESEYQLYSEAEMRRGGWTAVTCIPAGTLVLMIRLFL